uniref:Uncharacterized protein n=1 Tax=Meloidogyne enterolobii TaxID=390850 RepID=A0A6V7Y5P0_MELEN|nr:unnamed protein product [Meloidogyne enterolobii]
MFPAMKIAVMYTNILTIFRLHFLRNILKNTKKNIMNLSTKRISNMIRIAKVIF